MQPEFWHKKWASNQIGFHLPDVNPYLQRFWPGLNLAAQARVLVPLCGKSLDLLWLAGRGHRVLGIELSEKAVEDFSASNNCSRRSASTASSRFTALAQSSCGAVMSLR